MKKAASWVFEKSERTDPATASKMKFTQGPGMYNPSWLHKTSNAQWKFGSETRNNVLVDKEKAKVPCSSAANANYRKIVTSLPSFTIGARFPNNTDSLTMNVRANVPGPNAYEAQDLPNLRLKAQPRFSIGKDTRDRSAHAFE